MTNWTNQLKPTMTVEYIATEALDFLMTEDGDYLVTNQSNIWTKLLKPLTSWTNLAKPTI
jgi:hypothetical protein